jgi:hypothetical protein
LTRKTTVTLYFYGIPQGLTHGNLLKVIPDTTEYNHLNLFLSGGYMQEIDRLYDFLKRRKFHNQSKLGIVNVQKIGGGKDNYCLTNAEDNARSMGYGVVSGWLVLPSKVQENDWQKQFTQHWWNYDRNRREHLDSSPNIDEGSIYIQDDEISKFIDENKQILNSHVSSSVIMRNDMYYAIDYGESGYKFHHLDELRIDRIFFFQTTDRINSRHL